MSEDDATTSGNENLERICEWIYDRLHEYSSVSQDEFLRLYARTGDNTTLKLKWRPAWNRAAHAIHAILLKTGSTVTLKRSVLKLVASKAPGDSELLLYTTPRFQPTVEREAKECIGELIAPFLKEELLSGKTIFLGSGTTIFHVGLRMRAEGRRYDQRFVTVNIPLATAWCREGNRPVDHISVPAAVLDTGTFRFSTMPGFPFPLTVSIVAADGCFYDDGKVVLYGNEESVSANTSQFVENTKHSVICCLTSTKIKRGFSRNPDTGPPISSPRKGVIRVLVTDECDPKHARAFGENGWKVVTKREDWQPVLAAMKFGQERSIFDSTEETLPETA